ncbi:hypothetical protein [Halobacteriovorax sp. JY17]|uniref:hypothetical protein n=1 Tax=Halobacteriovorax sp. JY17 TaxID=2014617 RepID=UPI000C5A9191|nr:hypothetical protein [Halobacteriovorax sp. JY17]PIK16175.1 MAG: hypothetical protein CES88_05425 [Halobacteriovorax sp. JY17]
MKKKEKITHFRGNLLKESSPEAFNLLCDEFFLYDYNSIEISLKKSETPSNLYLSETLREEALNTSWYDYFLLIQLSLKKGIRIIDIGSGYSKGSLLSLVLGFTHFLSVELVPERIEWAINKAHELGLCTESFIIADILEIDLRSYDALFLYQPTGEFLTSFLNKVSKNSSQMIWAIESHGDLIPRLDLDSRLFNKEVLTTFSSMRHDSNLYSYKIKNSPLTELLSFESLLYQKKFIEIKAYNKIYGNYTWVSRTKGAFIDFINGLATLEIKGQRISLPQNLSSLELTDSLGPFQEFFTSLEIIIHEEREQRILKVITSPENALELSYSGKVNERDLSNWPSS